MRAAVAVAQNPDDALAGLELKEWPEPGPREGWTRVRVKAASLNPHDTWTLRGVGHPAERIPIVLGCDGAGVTDDGREVVIHPVFGDALRGDGDQTLDPQRALLSETMNGTLADYLLVPDQMIVPKPGSLSFAEAACLGVTWGTAYRMLFTRAGLRAGDRVLVQGASGGVASAAIALASAAGARVYATARSEQKRAFALECGAVGAFEPGARLPERVDVVVETVGEATWAHSLRALRPGGTVVIAGATTGGMPPAELQRIFYQQLSIVGSTGCTRTEFESLLRLLDTTGVRPHVEEIGFTDIPNGFRRLLDGDVLGKIVVDLER
ncbi:zinc-binding dehydrogenase [Microbacterium azadirachtae]|uniref:NADPH:quinone reductase n=1 Tax=Microbacterium azadirachtae TaxID=582680 RepID=A0A1I6G7X3_9MICO|nr:zinc-binding dehydrogenase [Microbacterium azadirachtae]SDL36813.1 NADPH:quinone reductase [Microbacterium azadirachtae]SEF67614.1 NADPH:quinone reductase [Microbacterium azadirachtae]SEF68373.1 NADPH:quinone reductase [Microbacterium azadirachtae]SFR38211.1 NADPH:quinone reductase [Microbacterium azadirachtae]